MSKRYSPSKGLREFHESTQPTNSIDSELEEILVEMWEYGFNSNGDFPTEYTNKYLRATEALQAIKALYRKEIEEAIGEDEDKFADVPDYAMMKPVYHVRNTLRAELRAKLLPPTKGGNE